MLTLRLFGEKHASDLWPKKPRSLRNKRECRKYYEHVEISALRRDWMTGSLSLKLALQLSYESRKEYTWEKEVEAKLSESMFK